MDSPTGPPGGIAPPVDDTAAAVVDQLRQQNVQMNTMGRMLEEMRVRLEAGDTERANMKVQRQQDLGRIQELRDQAAAAVTAVARSARPRDDRMFDSSSAESFSLWSSKFGNYLANLHDKAKSVLGCRRYRPEEVSSADRNQGGKDGKAFGRGKGKSKQQPMFWGTSKGKCFHSDRSCRCLLSAGQSIPVQMDGRRPCQVCWRYDAATTEADRYVARWPTVPMTGAPTALAEVLANDGNSWAITRDAQGNLLDLVATAGKATGRGKGKGKGKCLGALTEQEEERPGAEPEQELGGVDLCAVDDNSDFWTTAWRPAEASSRRSRKVRKREASWVARGWILRGICSEEKKKQEVKIGPVPKVRSSNRLRALAQQEQQEPADLAAIDPSYTMKIQATVDSGAALNVMPESWFQDYPLRITKENGKKYRAANGQLIKDEGLRSLNAVVRSGNRNVMRKVNCRVTQVNKMLLAVSKIVDAGNKVQFSEEESFIQNTKSMEKLPLRRENGVYVLDLEVMSADTRVSSKMLSSVTNSAYQEPDFTRQAVRKP